MNEVPVGESCVYRSLDGLDLVADVHRSGGDEPRPAVLWFHGGGMIYSSRRHIPHWQLRRYLDEGFAVVTVDYRLAPEVRIESVVDDAVEAYRWVLEDGADRFGFDPQRVSLVGHSAGGFLALMVACRAERPPAAVVSFYGYGSLGEWARTPNQHYRELLDLDEQAVLSAVGGQVVGDDPVLALNGRAGYYLLCRQQGGWLAAVCGDGRELDTGWLSTFEPVKHMTARFPPTLLLHGDADVDVPVQRSLEVAEVLADLGVDHHLVRHPDWAHVFDMEGFDPARPVSDPAVLDAMDQVIHFLQARLGA